MPTTPLPERLMPLAARTGLRLFYGDIHNHCALSYGHGSLEDALVFARAQLDFVSVTGHAHWPDMPVDDPRVAHIVDFHVRGFARLHDQWPGHFALLQRFSAPGVFTVFPGYEIHSGAHGDRTILLQDLAPAELVKADTPAALDAALRARFGDRAMAFPHHIAYRTGARGINWSTFDAAQSPIVELLSMHGCAESSLVDRPFLHSMGPGDGHNTVFHGWSLGHAFGVVGNTDHHSGHPGSYGHGRACVLAPENTADAIWQALRARHTGALTGDNCHLFARIGTAVPGDIIPPTRDATIEIEAVGGSFIDCIDVIRNGRIVQRVTPALAPCPLSGDGDGFETLLVLELGWGARNSHFDWQGDIRLDDGEILAIEPRLRGPEIVSPLEGGHDAAPPPALTHDARHLRFALRAHANPNNATQAMQTIAARVRLGPDAVLHADFNGHGVCIPARRLVSGAVSGNLGPIDSPAFRFHPLPRPNQWQWQGRLPLGDLEDGDWTSLRMRQMNGQMAWTTAFFCRAAQHR